VPSQNATPSPSLPCHLRAPLLARHLLNEESCSIDMNAEVTTRVSDDEIEVDLAFAGSVCGCDAEAVVRAGRGSRLTCYDRRVSPADPASRAAVGIDTYLAAERVAETKHELWGGEVFAMAGASFAHNKIVANVVAELRDRLRARPCDVLPSDLRVFIPAKPGIVYPDITVVCAEPRFRDGERDVLLNPTLVVEVLSEGTERFDRGDKFAGYRSVESIRQVVLVSQVARRVEVYSRADAGRWMMEETIAEGVVRLEAIDCEVALDEVYLKVLEAES